MLLHSIPVCYFPSTVLFVDDSRDFLLNFVLQLDEQLAYRVFDRPQKALDYLTHHRSELDMLSQRCMKEYTEVKHCPLTNQTINLDLAAIHAEIYNPQRFTDVSVVVVDYAMPEMDGLEFCRRIDNPGIKKILLTGKADEKLAIQAFNQGLIHRFVQKNDPDAIHLITEAISEMQMQYFLEMSNLVVRMLSVSSPSCLKDKAFSEVFRELCREKAVVEYYLADNSGSFLMLNEDAEPAFLLVKSEADMKLLYDMALDNGADETVLDALSDGEQIPCLWQPHVLTPQWNEWSSFMVPATKLQGERENWFYAYIQGSALFNLKTNEIASYHHYLDELDAEELLNT